ncbi:hypothetical protein MMC34_006033 [Xylographa carneopallida]|nr:hypothetical protein [Xylographa carneopallida]
MAANTLAISGQKRTADHFDSARKRFHNFGGDDWLEKFKAYGVPVSPKVFFDKEDETVGKDKLDMKRTKMCNRLWGLPISHSVHSKVGWESQDSMLTFQRLIAVGTTSLIAMATEDPPIILKNEYRRVFIAANIGAGGSGVPIAGPSTIAGGPSATAGGPSTLAGVSNTAAGELSTTAGPSTTTNVKADVSGSPRTIEDELLWARNAIKTLKRQTNASGWHEIVHRDICPSNVLLCDPDPQPPWDFYPIPKLVDFGDAIETGPGDNGNPENYEYETTEGIDGAPPVRSRTKVRMRFSSKSNVYQLGLIIAYATYLDPDSVKKAKVGQLTADHPYRISLIKAIESCLHHDPEERITPLALYRLTRACLADCTTYLTERAPDRFRIFAPTEAKIQDMATGHWPLPLVDVQFPLADIEPREKGKYLRPPTIDHFYPYKDDNLDFFESGDNGFAQRPRPADEVLPPDVISIADRGEHYYFNKLTDSDFDADTFDDRD